MTARRRVKEAAKFKVGDRVRVEFVYELPEVEIFAEAGGSLE